VTERLAPSPEHLLEMLYHRELGFGLYDGNDHGWSFGSAFKALNYNATDKEIQSYRDYFIEHGFGKFDGREDPAFRISSHGEHVARLSIARRKPWYSLKRLQTYNWNFWGAIAAIVAAVFALAALFKA
jgi:hypothetical protein